MKSVKCGSREKLSELVDVNGRFSIELSLNKGAVYNFYCLGLDSADKLSDDRYLLGEAGFSSAEGEIKLEAQQEKAVFEVCLAALPGSINKLVFAVSAGGKKAFSKNVSSRVRISQNGGDAVICEMANDKFVGKRAVIALAVYRREGAWRVHFVGQGFNGGYSELLCRYGKKKAVSPDPALRPEPGPKKSANNVVCPKCGGRVPKKTFCCDCGAELDSKPEPRLETVFCPNCGKKVPKKPFCCECRCDFEKILAGPFTDVCPECGRSVPGEKYCCNCGKKLNIKPAPRLLPQGNVEYKSIIAPLPAPHKPLPVSPGGGTITAPLPDIEAVGPVGPKKS